MFEEYTLDQLLTSDTVLKRAWIDRIKAARRAIDLPEQQQQPDNELNMTQLTLEHFGWNDE